MRLNDIYRSILAFAGIQVDSDGFAYTQYKDSKKPFLIKNQRLALPTQENLKNFQPGEMIIFHPLSENIAQGESEVISKLKYSINVRLNYTFGIISQSLLSIVNNVDLHKNLNPDQTELLIEIGSVDQTSMTNFTKIMLAVINENPDSGFLNIYLRRGGRVFDKKYSRAGIVNFSLYKELKESTNNTIKGIKVREKDKELFLKIYKFIFPKIDQPQAYDYGSESSTAPFLDSLMKTALNIAGRFNDILDMFEKEIDSSSDLVFDSDWVSKFDNLDALIPEIRRIPMQHGNDGSNGDMTQYAQKDQPALQTPTAYPANPQMPQQQIPQHQMPVDQGIVKNKDGKIDFAANMHRNPAVAAAPSPFMPPAMMAPQMVQNRVPSWAMPNQPQMYPPMYPQQQMPPQMYPQQQQMPPQMYPPQQQMPPQMYPQQQMPPQMYPQQQMYPPQQMPPQMYPPQQQMPPQMYPQQQMPPQMYAQTFNPQMAQQQAFLNQPAAVQPNK